MDGVERGLKLPEPCNINLFTANEDELSTYESLPVRWRKPSTRPQPANLCAKCCLRAHWKAISLPSGKNAANM